MEKTEGNPATTRRTPEAGHVYVIYSYPMGKFKIGCSANMLQRFSAYQTGTYPFRFICAIPTADKYKKENELHRQFNEKRHGRTEWFDLDHDDLIGICPITNPDEAHAIGELWNQCLKSKEECVSFDENGIVNQQDIKYYRFPALLDQWDSRELEQAFKSLGRIFNKVSGSKVDIVKAWLNDMHKD